LLGGEMWRGSPVSAQYSVPRQVVAVLGEDATHQPGPARQAGAGGDLSVSEYRARGDSGYRGAYPLHIVDVHR
jgi:hypothetical protein